MRQFWRFTLLRRSGKLVPSLTETSTMRSQNTFTTLYLSAPDVIDLVRRKGIEACLRGIADNIHADFLRWQAFDKSARVASHSRDGVIELMPIADGETYAFKYVNGH